MMAHAERFNSRASPGMTHSPHTQQSCMQYTIQIDGIDIHIEGEGSTNIVMLHGWPDTYRVWDAQVVHLQAHLKAHFRCVRFTQPGFDVNGPRRAYSLEELIAFYKKLIEQTCPGQKVVLMLHDWGCFFGYQFAMRHPELVAKVVGIDVGDANSADHLKSLPFKGKLGIVAYQAFLLVAWRVSGWGAVGLGNAMTRWMARTFRCPAEPALIGACMTYPYDITWTGSHGSYRQTQRVALTCPHFFAYGRRKPFMFHSQAWADRVAATPGNEVHAYDTGHWVMHRGAVPFNAAVTAWLLK